MIRVSQTPEDTSAFQIDLIFHHDPSVGGNSTSEDIRVVLPSRKFKKLPFHIASETTPENEDACLICQHHIVKLQKYIILPVCCHIFHRKCIRRWLCKYRAQCPHCRQDVIGGKPMLRDRALSSDMTGQSNMQLTTASDVRPFYTIHSLPSMSISNLDIFHNVMVFITSALAQSDEDLFSIDDESEQIVSHSEFERISQVLTDIVSATRVSEENNSSHDQNNPENLSEE